ncbi:MAG: AraC family transcriptional regulator [Ruminococcus sp.]|nr:AraC family transcriptional regulator [Ruminococcus sp.]
MKTRENIAYCSTFNPDFSETVAYNNPLFPAYVRYGILSAYPDYSAISHWHNDLEFILIKKGKMTYNVNGELIELSENSGIMVNSRQLHYGFSEDHTECEFICIVLSPELLRVNEWFYQNHIERITGNPSYPWLFLAYKDWQADILEKVEKIYLAFGQSFTKADAEKLPYFELLADFADIMRILSENLEIEAPINRKESLELNILKNMIAYVEEHFAERITLEKIASAGACCKSRCSSLFKKYLRDTPMTYTMKLRLRKSLSSLLESDDRITDIAYEHGFGGASYYCEAFQKYYGMSPLQYRKGQLS